MEDNEEQTAEAPEIPSRVGELRELKFRIQGIRPLIMANPQTVQLSNHYAIKAREMNRKMKDYRKAADERNMVLGEQNQMRNDWESSAYWDDTVNRFYLPDTNILAAIREGAAATKKGKDIERAVSVTEPSIFIETKKYRTLDAAYADASFRLSCPCKIPPRTGALIWKCRCMIPTGWTMEFSLEYNDEIFTTPQELLEIVGNAGKMRGIGGWRPKFGRFLAQTI